jgi:hypothetical protein
MTIVYLYTALCTVGGADRSIIQKANYLADEMHQDVFIITDSQKERPPVFPISPRIRHIDIGIDFDRQYHHNLLVRGYYYFTLMHLYRKNLKVAQDGKCFNLAGQQVGKGYKGIVIKNGKKMVIK